MSHDIVFDFINSIHESKEDLMNEKYQEKDYQPFYVNHYLSSNIDTLLYAQQMNEMSHLSNRMQYDYLRICIRSRKRRCTWGKKIKIKNVDSVKLYYNCSTKGALRYLEILSEEEINKIILACNSLK